MSRHMPVLTERDRTLIPVLSASEIRTVAQNALEEARKRLEAIEAVPIHNVNPADVLEAWDDASTVVEDAFGPISLPNSVSPEKEVRDAGDVALVQESGFMTELFQREPFYERVKAVKP